MGIFWNIEPFFLITFNLIQSLWPFNLMASADPWDLIWYNIILYLIKLPKTSLPWCTKHQLMFASCENVVEVIWNRRVFKFSSGWFWRADTTHELRTRQWIKKQLDHPPRTPRTEQVWCKVQQEQDPGVTVDLLQYAVMRGEQGVVIGLWVGRLICLLCLLEL